jgi:hypothetical protein
MVMSLNIAIVAFLTYLSFVMPGQITPLKENSLRPNNDSITLKVIAWSEAARRLIILQTSEDYDSLSTQNLNPDGSYSKSYFKDRILLLSKFYNKDNEVRKEIRYSKNKLFELQMNFCAPDILLSELILFKGYRYGLSTQRQCNSKQFEQGCMIKNIKIGTWEYADSVGGYRREYYPNTQLLDSLPTLEQI